MKKFDVSARAGKRVVPIGKIIKTMKVFLFIMLVAAIHVSANSYSQEARFNLDMKNVSIKRVLEEIEQQSEFRFLYSNTKIDVERKVDVKVRNSTIEEVFKKILSNSDIGYKIVERQILLSNTSSSVSRQSNTITGKITNTAGEPIPGVTIVVKGTTQGTITDADGNYSLSNISPDATLVFSFVGMKSQEVAVLGKQEINVVLEEETIGLEEVVAIGYGTMKKSDLTGSVTTVSTKDFDKVPATSVLQTLQGRIAGVQITTNSGMPGAGANVLIRGIQSINGSNSPIYVVDGVIRSNIDNLNPNSIESVSVLKDASSSAIYGARAANGVILVTTKRGTGKTGIEITLNSYSGVQTESNLKLKLLNASQFLELWTESYENAGLDVPWDNEILSHYEGVDTDWKDLMMQTGVIQNYDLSVIGGSEKSNYYVSANFLDQKGTVIESGFNKYSLTFNSDHKIKDWIKFGNSLNIYSTKTEGDYDAYLNALRKPPITRAYEDNGDYGYIYNTSLEHMQDNPVWLARKTVNRVIRKGLQGNLYLTLSLMKGLEFTARGSMDYSNSFHTGFKPGVPPKYGWEGGNINSVQKSYGETIHWISDFLLNYSTTINDIHDIKALIGYSQEESASENLWGRRNGTPNDEIQFLNAGDPVSQLNGNGFSDWAFVSMFGRLNYTFKNKYLVAATIRRDGTSRLSEGHRFGIFPSASLAWRVSEESFLKEADFIDDLKLRASYGILGNILSVSPYGTIASLSERQAVLNQAPAQTYTLTRAVNSGLKWESVSKKNFGIDATLLNSKLYTTIDFFIEDTYDLLFSDPIPTSTGLSGSPLINAGQVRNSGYELEIGYRGQKSDWSYDVSFNLSHVKNEVIDLGGRDLRTSGLVEGYPVRSFFGYKSNGIIRNESQLDIYKEGSFTDKQIGDIALLDIDGYDADGNLSGIPDGKVDAADRTIIGKRYPDFIYGALGTVGYKNWSLQMQLQGVSGNDVLYGPNPDATRSINLIVLMSSWARNEDARILDRYHPTKNPNGTWPRLSKTQSGRNQVFSEFWLENASYLRIQNVNLNYNLPQKYCGKVGMSELGLYISVQNAYTFTKFIGPRVDITSSKSSDGALRGVPQPRTWTFGLKVTF